MRLECSSKGDKRFSAFYSVVDVFGNEDTIENHYQLSKRILGPDNKKIIAPINIGDIKGKEPVCFEVQGKRFENRLLTAFYSLLWVKYLDDNQQLVEYAKQFNEFSDMFRGNSINCQADVIAKYIKEGRASIMEDEDVKEFLRLLTEPYKAKKEIKKVKKQKETLEDKVTKGDLLEADVDIIAHQVNCQGVMGAGIALSIKNKYPKVYESYNHIVTSYKDKKVLLGRCLMLSENGEIVKEIKKEEKVIANLFGQYDYGKEVQIDYQAFQKSLTELKDYAVKNSLSVGLPYGIGCGLAGGDWEKVKKIIDEVFNDYSVNIYKL